MLSARRSTEFVWACHQLALRPLCGTRQGECRFKARCCSRACMRTAGWSCFAGGVCEIELRQIRRVAGGWVVRVVPNCDHFRQPNARQLFWRTLNAVLKRRRTQCSGAMALVSLAILRLAFATLARPQ